MLIQQLSNVSTFAPAAKVYATPQLSRFGSIRDVTTSGTGGANTKTGNAVEGNPGGGGGDVWRP